MSIVPFSQTDESHKRQMDYSPRRPQCLACDAVSGLGVRVISRIVICRGCLEAASVFSEQSKCFWCREHKNCHRFTYLASGEGGVPMCQDCRNDFLRRLALAERNKRTRIVITQASLLEVASA